MKLLSKVMSTKYSFNPTYLFKEKKKEKKE